MLSGSTVYKTCQRLGMGIPTQRTAQSTVLIKIHRQRRCGFDRQHGTSESFGPASQMGLMTHQDQGFGLVGVQALPIAGEGIQITRRYGVVLPNLFNLKGVGEDIGGLAGTWQRAGPDHDFP